ncbi:DUF1778 domain-containing protein [Dichelobacter nodosus]|uniref:Orf86 n=1 Tax=Dichelobacter nodosus TaxID=870 RepID=Q5I739_DICNO|nr:DUF1778 domain-containing protein [Dichelobacter nodosus]AAW31841.1 Orf86 [Dichelobacter nodosus]KNZ39496.1 hypothetical protein AKG33_03530 [Dichelobacter nodosus]
MQASERINIRTTPQAKALIERVSQKLGVSVSSFMAQSAYEKALNIEQSEMIYLNQAQWQQVLSLLDDEPSEEMNNLLSRGYRAIGR